MKKLHLATGRAVSAGIAAMSVSLGLGASIGVGLPVGYASPGDNSTLNVTGEPYAKAVAILRAQGVKASFGGSVGSDVPQALCIVKDQRVVGSGKVQLDLDCTAEAQPQQPAAPATSGAATAGAPVETARPTPGAPGVVTVVPKQVG